MSPTFAAVLAALAQLDRAYVSEVARHAGVERAGTSRILTRMRQLGLVVVTHEEGDTRVLGRGLRTYYAITPAGMRLATQLSAREPC